MVVGVNSNALVLLLDGVKAVARGDAVSSERRNKWVARAIVSGLLDGESPGRPLRYLNSEIGGLPGRKKKMLWWEYAIVASNTTGWMELDWMRGWYVASLCVFKALQLCTTL